MDQFASCQDPAEAGDSNNEWSSADRPSSSVGCFSGDVITPTDYSVSGQLCGREPGDWYGQIVVPCDTLTLVASVRATPLISCEQSDWEFKFNRGGAVIDCSNALIQCSEEGDSKVIRWSIEPSGSLSSYYYGVVNPGSAQFPYEIEFHIE